MLLCRDDSVSLLVLCILLILRFLRILKTLLFLQVLKGITDDELKILDEFEDAEYDRKAVEVALTVTTVLIGITNSLHI